MKMAYVFVALGALGCNTRPSSSPEANADVQQARAAIRALEERDASEVRACEADARSCFESLADGGPSDACEELRDQCREAKEALDDVRTPVVNCWRDVEECAERGKAFPQGDASPGATDAGASCAVRPRDCEDMGEEADEDRNPVLECRSEVRECLRSVRHRGDWRAECGEAREACGDICGLAGRASRERPRGRAEGARQRMRQLLETLRERRHGGRSRGDHESTDDRADAGGN